MSSRPVFQLFQLQLKELLRFSYYLTATSLQHSAHTLSSYINSQSQLLSSLNQHSSLSSVSLQLQFLFRFRFSFSVVFFFSQFSFRYFFVLLFVNEIDIFSFWSHCTTAQRLTSASQVISSCDIHKWTSTMSEQSSCHIAYRRQAVFCTQTIYIYTVSQ